MKKRILISSCLLGVECNYAGKTSSAWLKGFSDLIKQQIADGVQFIPVCPEQLGGMNTPRRPSELQGPALDILSGKAKITSNSGEDVTRNFVVGAEQALHVAKLFDVDMAVLKSKSPSCGSRQVYDGTFSGVLVDGRGIAACLLAKNGVKILNEKEFLARFSV